MVQGYVRTRQDEVQSSSKANNSLQPDSTSINQRNSPTPAEYTHRCVFLHDAQVA